MEVEEMAGKRMGSERARIYPDPRCGCKIRVRGLGMRRDSMKRSTEMEKKFIISLDCSN
jgi:hypothetical protein